MNEQLFEDYLREARDEFVMEINSNEWNTKVRTAAESFLICFDQLRDRFLAASSKEVESEEKVCTCGVPNYLHATCCGWGNANLIIFPKNEKEVEWQKMKLAATNSDIRITKDGVFVSSGFFVSQPIEQTKEVSTNLK